MFWNRCIWFVEYGWSTDWGNRPFCEVNVFTSGRKARKAFVQAVEELEQTGRREYDQPGEGRKAALYSLRRGYPLICDERNPLMFHDNLESSVVTEKVWRWDKE